MPGLPRPVPQGVGVERTVHQYIGRLADAHWPLADLLIASDGEFGYCGRTTPAAPRLLKV